MPRLSSWSTEEIARLREAWGRYLQGKANKKDVVELLVPRTWRQIDRRAAELGLGSVKWNWTQKEIDRLHRVWPNGKGRPRGVILELFPDRTWSALVSKASELKIRQRRRYLPVDQPHVIRQFFNEVVSRYGSQVECERHLGVADGTIAHWRRRDVSVRTLDAAARLCGYRLVLQKFERLPATYE